MKKIFVLFAMLSISLLAWAGEPTTRGGVISPKDAKALLAADKSAILLDVRTEAEFSGGHIVGAVLLPYDEITAESAAGVIPARDTVVVVYCRTGRRSAIAAKTLRSLGYRTVFDLGGINDWPYEIVK